MPVVPVNYRKQDASAEAIARDVDYACSIADSYVQKLPGGAASLVGQHVIELGPGHSLGTAALLACHGARVTAADRYLAPWDPDYHPAFFRAMLERLARERRELSPEPLLVLLAAGAFVPSAIACLHAGVEDLDEVPDGSVDLVLSNAVFEHVEDVPRALAGLARVTRRGGHGIHQVDFRDHRDFSRPLEYLTLDEEAFRQEFAWCKGECGNRWRHSNMGAAMEAAGFQVLEFSANMFATDDYLADLRPRLHPEQRGLDGESLRIISGCFLLKRKAALNTEYPVETDHPQTLAHSRARYAFAAQFAAGRRALDVGCGAGVGTRMLLGAGAAAVTGLEIRPEALELARAGDPDGRTDRYLSWDLEQGLPGADGSVDLVVCLEVLEHIRGQARLVAEARRVLSPDGVALISVPNHPFEQFWTGLAGESNPYHLHVPDFEEFVALLAEFEWVEFFGQIDTVASLVLPLEGGLGDVVRGSLTVQAGAPLSERGTTALLALCRRIRPAGAALAPPAAHAYGNYQSSFGSALEGQQNLTRDLQRAQHERFAATNRLRWQALDAEGGAASPPAAPEPGAAGAP
jgi:SAM-dependent methyltransferase